MQCPSEGWTFVEGRSSGQGLVAEEIHSLAPLLVRFQFLRVRSVRLRSGKVPRHIRVGVRALLLELLEYIPGPGIDRREVGT